MTTGTFSLLLKCFVQSILSTLLRVVLPSVTILLLKYCFKILFTPLLLFTLNVIVQSNAYDSSSLVFGTGVYQFSGFMT